MGSPTTVSARSSVISQQPTAIENPPPDNTSSFSESNLSIYGRIRVGEPTCVDRINSCVGRMIFGSGYVVMTTGIALGFLNEDTLVTRVCGVGLFSHLISHLWWIRTSQTSLIDRASDEIGQAAEETRLATIKVQQATAEGGLLASHILEAAKKIESGADRVHHIVGAGRVSDLERNVSDTQSLIKTLTSRSVQMQDQLTEFRSSIVPLVSIAGNFRLSLQEIRRTMISGLPKIQELEKLETKFKVIAETIQINVDTSAKSVEEILCNITDEALITLKLLRDNNRILTELLDEKSVDFESAVDHFMAISQKLYESEQQREDFLRSLESQYQENERLQQRIERISSSLANERSMWTEQFAEYKKGIMDANTSIAEEENVLASFVERLQSIVGNLGTQSYSAVISADASNLV